MFLSVVLLNGCKKEEPPVFEPYIPEEPTSCDTCKNVSSGVVVPLEDITDTYPAVVNSAPATWGPYNVHDPSIIYHDGYYYCYNTDVAYGRAVEFGSTAGHQIRRSRDMIAWEYRGTAFTDYPVRGEAYINAGGGTPNENLWAPYITEYQGEFRLYYSLASNVSRLSCIGLATAPHPEGPWTEQGVVVSSVSSGVHTNAIDPTVITTDDGKQYMYYGSSWDGIYRLELDPLTGLSMVPESKGVRVAHRGFTGGTMNGNIEGPEIIYNEEFDKYYLFIAYDWLATKYNVRVVRSDNPEGPFYDYDGNPVNVLEDNGPMIIAPYAFQGHRGWQGVSHPSVFKDENGDIFIAHQGRPAVSPAYMVLHVRKLFWTEDGWPIASPQRYAGVAQGGIAEADIAGDWERIVFGYRVVPGFADEQTSPDLQRADPLKIGSDGTLDDDPNSTWSFSEPWLTLNWADGTVEKVHVSYGRDWENDVESTLVFTGFDDEGTTVWGKKVD